MHLPNGWRNRKGQDCESSKVEGDGFLDESPQAPEGHAAQRYHTRSARGRLNPRASTLRPSRRRCGQEKTWDGASRGKPPVGIKPANTRLKSECSSNTPKEASGLNLEGPRRPRNAAAQRKTRCRGHVARWYHIRLARGRSWVQSPGCPLPGIHRGAKNAKATLSTTWPPSAR